MKDDILAYNSSLTGQEAMIAVFLAHEIMTHVPNATSKLRHGHPVWFVNGNPIVGYSTKKEGISLMFRSGQSFNEPGLSSLGKFKAAEIVYTNLEEIHKKDLVRWFEKAQQIQRDYKNIVKRQGVLEKLV